jgi:hypothetical protein
MAKLHYKNILLSFVAQQRMQRTKYQGATLVPITPGTYSIDIPTDTTGYDTSILADNVPQVIMSWNTTYSVIPIPPNTNFANGFRVVFGGAAPAGQTLSYSIFVTP